jgi:hypothetical protein
MTIDDGWKIQFTEVGEGSPEAVDLPENGRIYTWRFEVWLLLLFLFLGVISFRLNIQFLLMLFTRYI